MHWKILLGEVHSFRQIALTGKVRICFPCRSCCNSPTQPASVGSAGLGGLMWFCNMLGMQIPCLNVKFIVVPGPAHEVKVVLLWLDSKVGASAAASLTLRTPSHQMPSSLPSSGTPMECPHFHRESAPTNHQPS